MNSRKYDIVHLIGHIQLDQESPRFSRVVLGAEKATDGRLGIDQIYDMDLEKTNLVVLSSCQSQLGKHTRGDDIISLSRAFMYAGSPSVVASLWNVDDEATKQLMVFFYKHLKEGLSKAEAVRAAQLDLQQNYPNPYYWAGFVLTGDPGNMRAFSLASSKQQETSRQ